MANRIKVGNSPSSRYKGPKNNPNQVDLNKKPPTNYVSTRINEIKYDTRDGSCGITILDEFVKLADNITKLNFVGADVLVEKIDGENTVNIYIPTPDLISNFNQNNSETDARVADFPTQLFYVAAPTSEGTPYKTGSLDLDVEHPCLQDDLLTYTTNEFFCLDTNATTFEVTLRDPADTVIATNTVILDDMDTVISDYITIDVTAFEESQAKYKAMVDVTIDISSILPDGGFFSVELTHHNTDQDYTKTQNNLFYDANTVSPSIDNVEVGENAPIFKWLSGIKFYDTGSTFDVIVNGMDYMNNQIYDERMLIIDSADLDDDDHVFSSDQISAWHNLWNLTGIDHTYTLDLPEGIQTDSQVVTASLLDWLTPYATDSDTKEFLISTKEHSATSIYEDFNSEEYRLTDGYSGWDSTASLIDNDGLQVYLGKLKYPQTDYTLYTPTNLNYSVCSGTRTFIRRFWHNNVSHSNGILKFTNINFGESSLIENKIQILISLDGTNWYDLNQNYLGGYLHDGEGCRINTDLIHLGDERLEFTFGTDQFTNLSTSWGMYIKVIFNESAMDHEIGSMEILNWV
jgi:hypothetical protein